MGYGLGLRLAVWYNLLVGSSYVGTVENHGKKWLKTAHFCENRKNHGSLYSC